MRRAWVLLAVLAAASGARAEDVYFDARTDFQAYEIVGPSAPAVLSRRRLVQNIGLQYSDELHKEGVVRWDFRARVRLDHEFGRSCLLTREYCLASTSPDEPDDYLFLSEDARVDVPLASIGLTGLPGQAQARFGRQLLTLGHRLRRIDGLYVSARPLSALAIVAHAGFLPLAGELLGSDTLAPQGALEDPGIVDRPRLWSLGAGATLALPFGISVRLGAEEVGEGAGSVERSLYAGSNWQRGTLRVDALMVWDPSREFVSDARGHLNLGLVEQPSFDLTAGVEAVYHHPRFDLGTVWAFFEVAPTTQVRLRTEANWTDVGVAVALMSRTTHFSDRSDQQDFGAETQLRGKLAGFDALLTAFGWWGDLDHWRGARLRVDRPLGALATLRAGGSLWDLSDPSRQVLSGVTVSAYAGVLWNVARGTTFSTELQHGYASVSGHRWRLMSSLSIEVWR